MKPTTIRGTKLRSGDKVYWIEQHATDIRMAIACPDNAATLRPKICSRAIEATNGKSFAFAKKWASRSSNARWDWIDDPFEYLVTLEEAEGALVAAEVHFMRHAQELVDGWAKSLLVAQENYSNACEQLEALKNGTHPLLTTKAEIVAR